jgi:hypothetical protein
MTDVPGRLLYQGFHLLVRDRVGTGRHAVQILDHIPNGRLAAWLVFGGFGRIRHHRDLLLIGHFPTEQALDGVSRGIAQFASSTYRNSLRTESNYQATSPATQSTRNAAYRQPPSIDATIADYGLLECADILAANSVPLSTACPFVRVRFP